MSFEISDERKKDLMQLEPLELAEAFIAVSKDQEQLKKVAHVRDFSGSFRKHALEADIIIDTLIGKLGASSPIAPEVSLDERKLLFSKLALISPECAQRVNLGKFGL